MSKEIDQFDAQNDRYGTIIAHRTSVDYIFFL